MSDSVAAAADPGLRGLIIYRASRLEALLEPLQLLMRAAPPRHALAPHELVAAHPGMQKWLSRELALVRGPRGIAANLRIELPSVWLDRLAVAVLGEEAIALRPYRREVLRWRIHDCLDAIDDPRLQAFLAGDAGSRAQRRFQLAERLARIYTRYLVYRPDWLADWAAGRRWPQANPWLGALWKMLHRRIGVPHRGEMLARLIPALAGSPRVAADDPLHVFGIAHLAPSELAVLRAVARRRPVVLYVPDPCREYWGGLRSGRRRLRELVERQPAAPETESAFLEQPHPLLASWGRMGQHFLLALDDADTRIDERHWQDAAPAPLDSRLQRLQESIRALRPDLIGAGDTAAGARADRSLRVHACHTRLRELEVLRAALLRERRDDATLKPSDIVVMMPDVQAYLPLLPTVFGEAGRHEGPLPYHCFDVAVARSHPLFAAFRRLLDLPAARVTATEVADLLVVPQIGRRLNLGGGDADVLAGWLRRGRVAWALDAAFRERFDVPAIAEQTFAWGMDRLLAGYLVGAGGDDEPDAIALPGGERIVPLEGIRGPEAALAGALDTLLIEIAAWCAGGGAARRASEWTEWFEQRLDALFAIDPTDAAAREAKAFVLRFVRALADEPAESGLDPALDFAVVRDVLLDRLDAVPERQRFLLGGVTFCGMVPQRAIPFRVVAVLGLDDGEFPRRGSDGGIDLMSAQPRLGDRDVRSDDRYLFLETVMSARDTLHLSYIGEGVRDGLARNPAAPLAELMAALDHGAPAGAAAPLPGESAADAERRRRPWLIRHPLQPFDERYFDDRDPALFSFDAAAGALCGDPSQRTAPSAFVADSLFESAEAMPLPSAIDLHEVSAYYKNPAKQVLAHALNLRLDAVDEDRLRDSEALEARVDAIEQVAKRLFNEAVVRADRRLPDAAPDWLRLTGVLPPGRAGDEAWVAERDVARALLDAVAAHELFDGGLPHPSPTRLEQPVALRDGRPIVHGDLRRVFEKNGTLWIMECYPKRDAESELDFKPRISFFLEWALLRLATPAATPVRGRIVIAGEHDDGWQHAFEDWHERFRARGGRDAPALSADLERRVAGLIEFWRRAQRQPQWYFPATSWALVAGGPEKARERWLGGGRERKMAERDYAPGYARLLAGDRDFAAGVDLRRLQDNALRLRALIDLARPLAEDAP